MMMQINDVKLVGNLVRDPELRCTRKGTPVANIWLGVHESYTMDGEKHSTVTLVEARLWNSNAENVAELAHKGQEIYLEGSLRLESCQDKQTGQNRSKMLINANSWQFTQHKGASARDVGMER
jgi:single-strand DNA-binding protein